MAYQWEIAHHTPTIDILTQNSPVQMLNFLMKTQNSCYLVVHMDNTWKDLLHLRLRTRQQFRLCNENTKYKILKV